MANRLWTLFWSRFANQTFIPVELLETFLLRINTMYKKRAYSTIYRTGLVTGLMLIALEASTRCAALAASEPTAGRYFSATALQYRPGTAPRTGKLYVGGAGMRFDYSYRGRPIVQISLPESGILRVLLPASRTFIEYKGRPGAGSNVRPNKPCPQYPGINCELTGSATINGLKAEVWRIVMVDGRPRGDTRPGRRQAKIWWDLKRKMPLRQEFADGRSMQALMTGTEKYENLQVERWEITYFNPDGRFQKGFMLFAPQLNMAVLERHPGGVQRQLRNIKTGAPDTALFAIPKDYRPFSNKHGQPQTTQPMARMQFPAPVESPGLQGPGPGIAEPPRGPYGLPAVPGAAMPTTAQPRALGTPNIEGVQ